MKNNLTIPHEDYLERIADLTQKKGYARVSDIAKQLHVSKPSVTNMVQRLSELGYIKREKYRVLVLTEKGKRIGMSISKRHQILAEVLTLLHIPDHIKEKDIENMEHVSEETISAFEKLVSLLHHIQKYSDKREKDNEA